MNDHDDETTTHRTRTNRRATDEAIAEANTVEAISAARLPEDVIALGIVSTNDLAHIQTHPDPAAVARAAQRRNNTRQKEGDR